MPIDIQPPVLTVTDHYRLPVSEKRFGVCGLVSFENGCYDGVRFIDSTGKEWYVEGAENMGFTSWLQLLWWRKEYKSIQVRFSLRKGGLYSIDELKREIEQFLVTTRLRGASFENKRDDVPSYSRRFHTVEASVQGCGYFDARHSIQQCSRVGRLAPSDGETAARSARRSLPSVPGKRIMAKAIVIDPGFSVADGDGPELAKDSDGLYARFKDWQEVIISIRFPGAMSHRWEAIDDSRQEGEKFDRCRLIEDSDWIAVHKAQGAIEPEEDYQHYKLNFNACGTLEVIAKGLELVAQQVDASESKPAGDP